MQIKQPNTEVKLKPA